MSELHFYYTDFLLIPISAAEKACHPYYQIYESPDIERILEIEYYLRRKQKTRYEKHKSKYRDQTWEESLEIRLVKEIQKIIEKFIVMKYSIYEVRCGNDNRCQKHPTDIIGFIAALRIYGCHYEEIKEIRHYRKQITIGSESGSIFHVGFDTCHCHNTELLRTNDLKVWYANIHIIFNISKKIIQKIIIFKTSFRKRHILHWHINRLL